ncbi:MAG: EAL domain-containing protein [Formivibrio sp.]|nr:EAL domain-containing protein [Formivibrio sp.]
MKTERGWRGTLYQHPILLIAGLFLAGLALVALGVLYVNQHEERSFVTFSEHLMQTFVEQESHELEKIDRDYAVWDDFFEHLHGETADQAWLEKNITESLYRNFEVVDALVLSAGLHPVYALHRGEPTRFNRLEDWNKEFASVLTRKLALQPNVTTLSGVVRSQQGLQMLVAERVRPEHDADAGKQRYGWLILARNLDPSWFEETGRLLSVNDVTINPQPPRDGLPRYAVMGLDLDQPPVGWMTWRVNRINGSYNTLYPLLSGLLVLFLIVLLLARSVLKMHRWQLDVHGRMLRQSETLRHLAHLPHGGENENSYFLEVANAVQRTLNIARVTLWRNDTSHGLLQCVATSGEADVLDASIDARLHGDYFRLLNERRILVATDVAKQPWLGSLAENWCLHGVKSMIDAAVTVRGRLSGVLCVEGVDHAQEWTQDQISFVSSAADLVAVAYESAERRRTEAALHRQQFYDVLTGLPNQLRLGQLVQQQLLVPGCRLVYALWSVSGLRDVNDAMGRAGGDQVLQEIARRLEQTLGEFVAARLAGNRFVLVLLNVPAPQVSESLERIHYRLREPITLENGVTVPQVTCGVSLAPQDALTADELLRHAEFALEAARSRNEAPIEFYAPEPNAVAREHYQLAGAMPAALLRGEFELYFQPFVDLNSRRVLGAEALLRWFHPEKGQITPQQFITIAEETGQIHALGRFVLEEACRKLRCWIEKTGKPLVVAVNASPLQLRDPAFPAFVQQVLNEQNLPPDALEIEITESMSIELFEQAPEALRRLREMGIRLSIDDFGTGYSSLSYLRRMPVNKLKIDKSFIEHVPGQQQDADLARMIISLGRILGMEVVGEGIENEEQLQFLQLHGCHIGQGYLFSRPVSAVTFGAILERGLPVA